jgi:hypothetical protein
MSGAMKRVIVMLYCYGILPARTVGTLFRWLKLANE